MKAYYAVLLALVLGVGCGKKEPELSTEKVITPDEAANELFVEAIELVSKAKSEENTNIPAAIKSYEGALVKVRKIVNEYKKSDLAVKLVSGETLFTGKSMAQIEERVGELQREAEERRRAEAEEEMRKARAKLLRWEFETGGYVASSPAIGSDGTVYVGSLDNKLYALDGKSGAKLWEFETGDEVRSSPAIGSDGTVYVGSNDKKLYALSGKSGVKLWEFETGGGVFSSPAIGSDGVVYVGSVDNKLYAINGKTGVKLWEFDTGSFVGSSPAIGSDGTVYVGSRDKKLYAINPKSGVKLWEFETGGGVTSSPAIGSEGTVYVGAGGRGGGKLYAIKTDSKGLAKSPWPMRGQNPLHTGRVMKK